MCRCLEETLTYARSWTGIHVGRWAGRSNTMETGFCLEALEKAFANTGQVPEIFNTDQGCQFTSEEWISRLEEKEIKVSMDGKVRSTPKGAGWITYSSSGYGEV